MNNDALLRPMTSRTLKESIRAERNTYTGNELLQALIDEIPRAESIALDAKWERTKM